ncbi:hypothetical protein [Trinickia sp. EG282A]|uniref:hypothetical protein n=1 Tax=Trinickia sp. EG282A TaxID=3237013 RepID=UPI0034D3434E
MRARGPLIRWNRTQPARYLRGDCATADGGGGTLEFRRCSSVSTVLSRRCVRRLNVVSSRAFVAVDKDGVASLLP